MTTVSTAAAPRGQAVSFVFNEPPIVAIFPGIGHAKTIHAVTPTSHTYLMNKDFTDPSNTVSATALLIGGTQVPLVATAEPGTVLTYSSALGITFEPPNDPAVSDGTNTRYGQDALVANTTGERDSALGYRALYSNTTGSDNTGLGHRTLYWNPTGSGNTAVGSDALGNFTGRMPASIPYNDNTAVGANAMAFHVGGDGNTAIGVFALSGAENEPVVQTHCTAAGAYAMAGGYNPVACTAMGYNALAYPGYALECTAVGYGCMRLNAGTPDTNNPQYMTAMGAFALSNTNTVCTSSHNTAYGAYSMTEIPSTITGWTSFGYRTGANAAASPNTLFGYRAGEQLTTGVHNCAFGKLALTAATTASLCTAVGDRAGQTVTTGVRNTFIGSSAGDGITTGNNNTFIGAQTSGAAARTGCLVIGTKASPTTDNQFVLASADYPIATTSSAGGNGAANALPATPAVYLGILLNGQQMYMPAYVN